MEDQTVKRTQVRVDYRQTPLFSDAVLELRAQGGFIPTDMPMPVGTVLELTHPDADQVVVEAVVVDVREPRRTPRSTDETSPTPGMSVRCDTRAFSDLAQAELAPRLATAAVRRQRPTHHGATAHEVPQADAPSVIGATPEGVSELADQDAAAAQSEFASGATSTASGKSQTGRSKRRKRSTRSKRQ